MRNSISKIMGIVLLLAISMLCQSCTDAKCEAKRQLCNLDCPKTIGLKQACEQACNISYDICRSKK